MTAERPVAPLTAEPWREDELALMREGHAGHSCPTASWFATLDAATPRPGLVEAAQRVVDVFDAEDRALTDPSTSWGALASEEHAALKGLRAALASGTGEPDTAPELDVAAVKAALPRWISDDKSWEWSDGTVARTQDEKASVISAKIAEYAALQAERKQG